MEVEQNVDRLAKALAAAYWRGRLTQLGVAGCERSTVEAMIDAASREDIKLWRAPAQDLLLGRLKDEAGPQ